MSSAVSDYASSKKIGIKSRSYCKFDSYVQYNGNDLSGIKYYVVVDGQEQEKTMENADTRTLCFEYIYTNNAEDLQKISVMFSDGQKDSFNYALFVIRDNKRYFWKPCTRRSKTSSQGEEIEEYDILLQPGEGISIFLVNESGIRCYNNNFTVKWEYNSYNDTTSLSSYPAPLPEICGYDYTDLVKGGTSSQYYPLQIETIG